MQHCSTAVLCWYDCHHFWINTGRLKCIPHLYATTLQRLHSYDVLVVSMTPWCSDDAVFLAFLFNIYEICCCDCFVLTHCSNCSSSFVSAVHVIYAVSTRATVLHLCIVIPWVSLFLRSSKVVGRVRKNLFFLSTYLSVCTSCYSLFISPSSFCCCIIR